jgi:mannose-1-phosphate guanylyltransferase
MTPDPRFHACIIAGGSGERFWPMSRARTPKHLLRLFSERTLLEEAVLRLKGVVADENVFILTNQAQVPRVREAIPGFPADHVIAEPAKRDTAPAAALATGLVRARRPDGVVALLPADALIRDGGRFGAQLRQAFAWASGSEPGAAPGTLLTFGVRPSYPATGFGYLELGETLASGAEGSRLLRVARFVEKPDQATAASYLADGRHLWNAGIFVWSAESFLGEVSLHEPALAAFIRDFPKGDPAPYLAERFAALPRNSVDYAVVEKAASVATVPADFDWDDVGSWIAVAKHLPSDAAGNVSRGHVVSVGSRNTIAVSSGRAIALCGLTDIVVVETPDAVLVCHKDSVQDIKKLLGQLPQDHL